MPSSTGWGHRPALTPSPAWAVRAPKGVGSAGEPSTPGKGRGQDEIRASPGNLSHPGGPRGGRSGGSCPRALGQLQPLPAQQSSPSPAGQGRLFCQGAQERPGPLLPLLLGLLSLRQSLQESFQRSCASPCPRAQPGPVLGSQAPLWDPAAHPAVPPPKGGSGEGLGGSDTALAPSGRGRELCHPWSHRPCVPPSLRTQPGLPPHSWEVSAWKAPAPGLWPWSHTAKPQ